MTVNSAMPGRSSRATPAGAAGRRRGSRRAPRTRQASDSGMFTAKIVCQPPKPMSSPPSVGPMTAMTWPDTDSAVSTPAGLRSPVRSASLRVRYIAAGYAADVPKPSRTRAATSTPRPGATTPTTPATPTSAVPIR